MALAAAWLCGCLELSPDVQRPSASAGAGAASDGGSGVIGLDTTQVPVVPGCSPGQAVARTVDGWACTELPAGPRGDTGDTGLEGAAAKVVAVAAGDVHCPRGGIRISATGGDTYVCNGAPGSKGDSGEPGARGDTGSQGNQGVSGDAVVITILAGGDDHCSDGGIKVASAAGEQFVCRGRDGTKGDTGAEGPKGGIGAQGGQGIDGVSVAALPLAPGNFECPQGGSIFTLDGVETYACSGIPGAQGDSGAPGPKGDTGSQGIQGLPGESATTAWLPPGDEHCPEGGVAFSLGGIDTYACNGTAGAIGDTGAQGPKGATGPEGILGIPGASVVGASVGPGAFCAQGGAVFSVGGVDTYACHGSHGAKGATGDQGAKGDTGPQGIAGDPGESVVGASVQAGDSHCANGGSRFTVGGVTTYACNGAPGASSVTDANWSGVPLSVPHGGTGGTDQASARAGLGLGAAGLMAVQDASNVSITGGSVNATHTGDGSGLTDVTASAMRSDTSGGCGSDNAGQVRYNAGRFEGCNGTAWKRLDNPVAPCPGGYEWIPPGSFQMGDGSTSPATVTISRAFCMKRTEVTRGEFRAVMGWDNYWGEGAATDLNPENNISWFAALDYANALSATEGLQTCYDIARPEGTVTNVTFAGLTCTGYRLPTEAEWEYAARAGTTASTYNGEASDATLDPIAWFSGNTTGYQYRAVGQKAPNPWDLYDMLGNVCEWVWAWTGSYPPTGNDPVGPWSSTSEGFRGGTVRSGYMTAGGRNGNNPTVQDPNVGFRLAKTAL